MRIHPRDTQTIAVAVSWLRGRPRSVTAVHRWSMTMMSSSWKLRVWNYCRRWRWTELSVADAVAGRRRCAAVLFGTAHGCCCVGAAGQDDAMDSTALTVAQRARWHRIAGWLIGKREGRRPSWLCGGWKVRRGEDEVKQQMGKRGALGRVSGVSNGMPIIVTAPRTLFCILWNLIYFGIDSFDSIFYFYNP
jgi:hypothetical protein